MTLKELLDKVSELCNDETKDLEVRIYVNGDDMKVLEIYHRKFKNDYIEINEIRIS